MRTILIFNDNSEEARHAAEFVLAMAQKVQANLLLANTYVKVHAPLTSPVTAGLVVNEGFLI